MQVANGHARADLAALAGHDPHPSDAERTVAQPARDAASERARSHSLAHLARGHRKIWAMLRHDGHVVSEATAPG